MAFPIAQVDAQRTRSADPVVLTALRDASSATGARFDTLLASAKIESGLRSDARASTSSATGLFQFTEQTWLNTVRKYGAAHGLGTESAAITQQGGRTQVIDETTRQRILALRTDPKASSLMAGEHLRDTASRIAAGIGRAPDATEVYLGHFLGSGGAVQMLQAGADQTAASILPAAARANAAMFYAADGTPYTAKQFVSNVRDRVARAYNDIGSSMPSGPLDFAGRSVTAGNSADPPDAGASGWGTNTPRRVASMAEKLMLSSLTQVVTRVDHSIADSKARTRRQDGLPTSVLSALQVPQIGDSTTA